MQNTEKIGMRSANWIGRLFIAAQIALCFIVNLGERGRIIASVVICISIVLGDKFKLSKSLHTVLLICSGLFFSCFALSRFMSERSAGLLDLFEMLAEYLIIVQSLELLRKRASSLWSYREANYLPGLGTIAVIMLLVSRENPLSFSMLTYLFSGFVILLVLVMRPEFISLIVGDRLQRRKAFTLAMIVAIGTSAGSLFQGEVARQVPILQTVLRRIQPPSDEFERIVVKTQARLVDRVDLSSVSLAQRTAPDELVFRVESAQFPGYMRTLSFERFDSKEWSNERNVDRRSDSYGILRISPLNTIPVELESTAIPRDTQLFALPERASGNYTELKVTVPSGHGRLVPLPLTVAFVIAASDGRSQQLVLDAHGNVLPNSIKNDEYRAFAGSSSSWPIDDNYRKRLLQLPAADSNFIQAYAAKVCGTALSTREKVKALEAYFIDNFDYAFESDAIGELRGRSPLRAFLENQEEGHCEYFATASTLLLRSQGIPCRLSTGYLVYEMNDGRDYYFARNRDAHAWAEAFDATTEKWIVVESTPGIRTYVDRFRQDESKLVQADGSTASTENRFASSLWEFLNDMSEWWNQVAASRFAWLIPFALVGALLAIRALRAKKKDNAYSIPVSRPVRQADKRASRLGYQRASSETCLQFADRLTESAVPELVQLAEWYDCYSHSRYTERVTER